MAPMHAGDSNVNFEAFEQAQAVAILYISDPSDTNTEQLSRALKAIDDLTRALTSTNILQPGDERISKFISVCSTLLTHTECGASIRSRLCLVVYHLSLHNPRLRRAFSSHDGMCAAFYGLLQRVISENLGPQNLIDALRVLQLLTYERCYVVGSWTFDLLGYLSGEILKKTEPEWLPYCCAILASFVVRSKTLRREFITKHYQKNMATRLMHLLSHDSRLVVVSCLQIIAHLGTTATSKVFCAENIAHVLVCGFNVLAAPDCTLTLQYAVDYLKSVMLKEAEHETQLTPLCRNFATASYFHSNMETVISLVTTLDSRSEESAKLYDFLHNMCRVHELRSPICAMLLDYAHAETGTTPLAAITRTAQLSFDESPLPELPIRAVCLLDHLLKEAIESGKKINERFQNLDTLIAIVEANVKTPIETRSSIVVQQCQRIIESLKMAQTLANDKATSEKLTAALTSVLCQHINETQRISNAIISYICAAPTSSVAQAELAEWNKCAVSIPIELVRLLNVLKDYSRAHKELYWRTLEDDRILPFVAFALVRGSYEQTTGTLSLVPQFAQYQKFSWPTLALYIQNCKRSLVSSATTMSTNGTAQRGAAKNGSTSTLTSNDTALDAAVELQHINSLNVQSEKSRRALRDLDNMLQTAAKSGAAADSQYVQILERKIALQQQCVEDYEQMCAAKEKAIQTMHEQLQIAQNMAKNQNKSEVASLCEKIAEQEQYAQQLEEKISSVLRALK